MQSIGPFTNALERYIGVVNSFGCVIVNIIKFINMKKNRIGQSTDPCGKLRKVRTN